MLEERAHGSQQRKERDYSRTLVCLRSTVQKFMRELGSLSEVQFTICALRRTYSQCILNLGLQLTTASLMLSQASTITTEKYYCRKREDATRKEILDIWQSRNRQIAKAYLTGNFKNMSNYV